MKCWDRKLGDDTYYSKENFKIIFDFNVNDNNNKLPIVFGILDNINAVMAGGGIDIQIIQIGDVDIEGLNYEDVMLLFKLLRDEREFLKLKEELKQKD